MATILISSYRRNSYLQWNLFTLKCQNVDWRQHEIIVLNDGIEDETLNVVSYFKDQGLPIRYIFTGQRNRNGLQWRVPGFCWNIGIKECDSKIVVLTCAEMYHIGNTLKPILDPVIEDSNALGTPHHICEDTGSLAKALLSKSKNDERVFEILRQGFPKTKSPFRPHSDMPFWMAINRKKLLDIGGFDEDFLGVASDDNDLMFRLIDSGCFYSRVDANVVHLYHGTRDPQEIFDDERFKYNRRLMNKRRGKIVRNRGREWGVLKEKFSDEEEYQKHEKFVREHQTAAAVLWNLLPKDYKVLDIGCGDGVLSNHIRAKVKCNLCTVDGWPRSNPDVLLNLEKKKLPFKPKSFDVILLMDVVEHLNKAAAIKLIKQCQKIAKVRIIAYTPKKWFKNRVPYTRDHIHKGNKLILHRSKWTEKDFIKLGFTVQNKFEESIFALWEAA